MKRPRDMSFRGTDDAKIYQGDFSSGLSLLKSFVKPTGGENLYCGLRIRL